jgi:cephalosporin hydroxylase
MKITIDTTRNEIELADGTMVPLYSDDAFKLVSHLWLKVGWNQKYVYTFTWFGVPVIQLPEDVMRYQEVVFALQPDVIVETGIAHGGSLVLSATLCKAMGKGRVIGVDIEIRPHNRARLESHPLFPLITLVEGSSIASDIVAKVESLVRPHEKVLVMLDSNHTYDHVMAELEAYSSLVCEGSYIVATDGLMRDLTDVPRGRADWDTDNPARAAEDFARRNKAFVIEEPAWAFNESRLAGNITYWPSAWLKRIG